MSNQPEFRKAFLARAHQEVSFPSYLDEIALKTLDNHIKDGSTPNEASEEVLNALNDGVLL